MGLCLRALNQQLSPALTTQLLTHYYVSSHGISTPGLVKHFYSLLLSSLGMDSPTGEFSWSQIQKRAQVKKKKLSLSALQLFNMAAVREACDDQEATPTDTTPFLKDHAETVLQALHLVYEVRASLKIVLGS